MLVSGAVENVDEFSLLGEVAAELGLPQDAVPPVRRVGMQVRHGVLSALKWGDSDPDVVFLHGGGQNAHTWDLVAMQLGLPALAVDLPGHGHSYWRDDRNYWPQENALAVAEALGQYAPRARLAIGMSLGGLTTIRLAGTQAGLVSRAVVVDVTPGVMTHTPTMTREQRGTTALIGGQQSFGTREEMIEQAVLASPRRTVSAVRRGVIHNSRQLPDGRWAWRYDRMDGPGGTPADFATLWDDLERIAVPVMLVRGGASAFVRDADAAEFAKRQPAARIEVVADAGHSVQSDQPVELARLIGRFLG
jgi:esterase